MAGSAVFWDMLRYSAEWRIFKTSGTSRLVSTPALGGPTSVFIDGRFNRNKHPVSSWKTPSQVESVAVLVCGVGFMTTVAYTTIYASKSPTQRKSDDSVALYAAKFVASYFFIAILAIMAWWLSKQDVAHQYGCTFEVCRSAFKLPRTTNLVATGVRDHNWDDGNKCPCHLRMLPKNIAHSGDGGGLHQGKRVTVHNSNDQ